MRQLLQTDNRELRINITINCKGRNAFKVSISDAGKKNSNYADRIVQVQNSKKIYFSLPITPKNMVFTCVNKSHPNVDNFECIIEEVPLPTYSIGIDRQTDRFLTLASQFSQVCGFQKALPKGRIYSTNKEEFTIKFYPVIIDFKSGRALNTPARIGHSTGNIDVSKIKFDKYTVAMRMIILLHEYSHVFRNPKLNLEIENEIGADINALYIYLGLGFSKVDALYVYAKIFLKAQTPGNLKRMRKIRDYISRFENEEWATRQ